MQLIQSSLEDEVHQILKNITAVLEAAKCTRAHVVKTTIFLTNMDDFSKVNELYGTYFDHKPARSTVTVAALPK
jgi:2-iminobutanoate/2-iminopropanoate deaminase